MSLVCVTQSGDEIIAFSGIFSEKLTPNMLTHALVIFKQYLVGNARLRLALLSVH